MQQRTAEQIEDAPEETVEAVRVAQRERVQQRTAEQIEDAPQSPAEVEAVTSVPRERVQQRTAETIGDVPETASQDRRLQRAVEQASVEWAEADKLPSGSGLRGCVNSTVSTRWPRYFKLFFRSKGSLKYPRL